MRYGPRGEPLFFDGRPVWYGLKGEPLTDLEASRLLRDIGKRRVAEDFLRYRREPIRISTVFLVNDSGFLGEDRPVLWETMVFGGPCDDHMDRYSSRADARVGHRATVDVVRALIEADQRERARRSRMHAAYRKCHR